MKKYLLFCYDSCYPAGGMGDYKKDFDSIKEAKQAIKDEYHNYDYYEIIDYRTLEEVEGGLILIIKEKK